jgi:hypothetical protein
MSEGLMLPCHTGSPGCYGKAETLGFSTTYNRLNRFQRMDFHWDAKHHEARTHFTATIDGINVTAYLGTCPNCSSGSRK